MSKEQEQKLTRLIISVGGSNPGAFRVMQILQMSPYFSDMLQFCRDWGITGSELWELYKDVFDSNDRMLCEWIIKQMNPLTDGGYIKIRGNGKTLIFTKL